MNDNGRGFILICEFLSVLGYIGSGSVDPSRYGSVELELSNNQQEGTLEGPMTWDNAKRTCDKKEKIISPVSSVNAPAYVLYGQNHTIWTSNHILNLGCIQNTDFCTWLYVEDVPTNESHQGVCNKTVYRGRQEFKQIKIGPKRMFMDSCRPSDLIDINDMKSLHEITSLLCRGEKYWIGSFKLVLGDKYVRGCEIFSKHKNKTQKTEEHLSKTKCNNKYRFSCVEGNHYHTVITLLSNPVSMGTSIIPDKIPSRSENSQYEFTLHQITSVASASAIVIGLIIIGCCVKRWITVMKNELIETLRQKYTHEMYEVERVETEPDVEAETPVSPGGSSLYENIYNQGELTRVSNRTVSYMTSRDIQRPVTVPASTSNNGSMPRVTLPRRLPSRENAIRQKNGKSRLKLAVKPVRKGGTFSNVSSSDDSHQHETEVLRDQTRAGNPFFGQAYRKSVGRKPKPSPKPDIKTMSLNDTRMKSIEKFQTIGHESNSDCPLYLNTGHESEWENPDKNDDEQNYENIWQNAK